MEKLKENLLIGAIIVFAVALYFLMPRVFLFLSHNGKGISGLGLCLIFALVMTAVFLLFGYRGKSLLYIFFLSLGIALMIWLYLNYRDLDEIIGSRYGQIAATGAFVAIVVLIWLFMRFFV